MFLHDSYLLYRSRLDVLNFSTSSIIFKNFLYVSMIFQASMQRRLKYDVIEV